MPQLQTDVTPANRRAVTSRYEIVAELKLTKQNKANRPTSLDTTRRITTESCVAKLMQHSRMDSHVSLHRSCKTLAALPSRHCQRTQTLTQNILLWRGPCEAQSQHTQVYSSLSLSLSPSLCIGQPVGADGLSKIDQQTLPSNTAPPSTWHSERRCSARTRARCSKRHLVTPPIDIPTQEKNQRRR